MSESLRVDHSMSSTSPMIIMDLDVVRGMIRGY